MLLSQIARPSGEEAAIDSTSNVNKVVVAYFFDLQYITLDSRVKICVEMLRV